MSPCVDFQLCVGAQVPLGAAYNHIIPPEKRFTPGAVMRRLHGAEGRPVCAASAGQCSMHLRLLVICFVVPARQVICCHSISLLVVASYRARIVLRLTFM